MKKILVATLLTVGAFAFAVQPTFAKDTAAEQAQKQTIKRKTEFKCDPAAYNETRTCYFNDEFSAEQEQRQKILAAQVNPSGRKVHVPADTAIDMTTLMIVMSAAVAGFGASYALAKLQ